MTQGKQQGGGKQGFAQDRELASEAGKKGGQRSHGGQGDAQHSQDSGKGSQGNFAQDRQKASEAGKKGGQR